jgi:nicotinate phosphoribosyltransferase
LFLFCFQKLFEFGLRRAQGPDGGISASRYSILGGFDGTSNVLAGSLFGVIPSGTMAHSFVTSFNASDRNQLSKKSLRRRKASKKKGGEEEEEEVAFLELVEKCREELGFTYTNYEELLAFTAYALAYPENQLVLIDTYDTLNSGVLNFLITALALHRCGYRAKGIRLDSGDMAWLSKESRSLFKKTGERFGIDYFENFTIVASSDLSEKSILALRHSGHQIDVFGVGTDIATCKTQPALGGVYKLVELEGQPRMKLSEDLVKVTLPGRKDTYRLYDKNNTPIFDVMTLASEGKKEGEVEEEEDGGGRGGGCNGSSTQKKDVKLEVPEVGKRILCRHLYQETKRAWVTPSRVEKLMKLVWDGNKGGIQLETLPTLKELQSRVKVQMKGMREDHLRSNHPTPYKVSATTDLYEEVHRMWLQIAPVREMM